MYMVLNSCKLSNTSNQLDNGVGGLLRRAAAALRAVTQSTLPDTLQSPCKALDQAISPAGNLQFQQQQNPLVGWLVHRLLGPTPKFLI